MSAAYPAAAIQLADGAADRAGRAGAIAGDGNDAPLPAPS